MPEQFAVLPGRGAFRRTRLERMAETLAAWAGRIKRELFDRLSTGAAPSTGTFDPDQLRRAQTLGKPTMGTTVYSPEAASFEFIYGASGQESVVLEVLVPAPEPIVYLPVPKWVVEQIWQGEVFGSFHFRPDAEAMLTAFQAELTPERNLAHFPEAKLSRR